ncbi:MAG: CBS domain-containing protein [Myxococcales bacterium]|nr:CBS domain-containing protein [Myxococcales bacterium]
MDRRVRDLMRRDFIRIEPDEDLGSVASLMGMARLRVLPVVAEGRLTGMIDHRVLARAALARACGGEGLAAPIDAYVDAVEPIDPDATLREAAELMVAEHLPCLPVSAGEGSERRLVGLLTEGDLLRAAYARS